MPMCRKVRTGYVAMFSHSFAGRLSQVSLWAITAALQSPMRWATINRG